MIFNKVFSIKKNTKFLIVLALSSICNALYSQCDETLLTGTFENVKYIFRCPSYQYSYTTYNKDNTRLDILNHNDIESVKSEFKVVDALVRKYVLKTTNYYFLEQLNFYCFEIVCLDSISAFENRIPSVDLDKCEAKYAIDYYFEPIENVKYCIGFALDENLKIITKNNFPKGKVESFEKTTICEIKDKGRKYLNAEVSKLKLIVYNNKFYWSLFESKKYVEGENIIRNILIESSDLSNYIVLDRKVYSEGDVITIIED